MIFSNSPAIFHAIEKKDRTLIKKEVSRYSKEDLAKCFSGLVRHKKIVKSYNLIEACCLLENEEALHDLLTYSSSWETSRLKSAASIAVSTTKYSLLHELLCFGFSIMDALIETCSKGNLDFANKILKNNTDKLNLADPTPVFKAASGGHVSILTKLHDHGFNLREKQDEALCIAVRGKHIKSVQFLISVGSDVNAQKEFPLKTAIVNGDVEMVKLLLNNGAKPIETAQEEYVILAERYEKNDIANLLRNKVAEMHMALPLNTKQSTHVIDNTAAESILKLYVRYGSSLHSENIDRALAEIIDWKNQLEDNQINSTAVRAINDLIYNEQIHEKTGLSLKNILILTWIAIHDHQLRVGLESDALNMLIEGLYEIQRGYNTEEAQSDIDICRGGKANKLMEKLVGIHPDVILKFVTKQVASYKLPVIVAEEARIYFEATSPLIRRGLFSKEISTNDIWDFIRENVKTRMYNEFSELFKSYDDVDFNAFIDSGIYTELDLSSSSSSQSPSPLGP